MGCHCVTGIKNMSVQLCQEHPKALLLPAVPSNVLSEWFLICRNNEIIFNFQPWLTGTSIQLVNVWLVEMLQLLLEGHGGADATSGASDAGVTVVAQTLHLEQVT